MKLISFRPALALALALGLSACGGKASFEVGGTIANLNNAGLVLSNAGATISPAAKASTFAFPNHISYGETYDVRVATQPRHQHCSILNQSVIALPVEDAGLRVTDTAGRLAAINIAITCTQNAYAISGTVSGLTADGLELTNGSTGGTVVVAKDATGFAFGTLVEDGTTYGVAVLTQPTGLSCKVNNGTGTMGEAPVTTIGVVCTPASIGG